MMQIVIRDEQRILSNQKTITSASPNVNTIKMISKEFKSKDNKLWQLENKPKFDAYIKSYYKLNKSLD